MPRQVPIRLSDVMRPTPCADAMALAARAAIERRHCPECDAVLRESILRGDGREAVVSCGSCGFDIVNVTRTPPFAVFA